MMESHTPLATRCTPDAARRDLSPMVIGDLRLPPRFWRRVVIATPRATLSPTLSDPCWLWTGYLDPRGYPRFSVRPPTARTRSVLAHRWAYCAALWRDYFSDLRGVDIHHRCKVRSCVRPAHMREAERIRHRWWHGKMRGYGEEVCTGSRWCLCWECCEKSEAEMATG